MKTNPNAMQATPAVTSSSVGAPFGVVGTSMPCRSWGASESTRPITKLNIAPIAIRVAAIRIDMGALRNLITLSDYS